MGDALITGAVVVMQSYKVSFGNNEYLVEMLTPAGEDRGSFYVPTG